MHDKHQEFFDTLAQEWDLQFTSEDLERLSHIADKLETQKGWNILDLGCGTGILFDLMRRKVGPTGSVTGVDFSFEMAEKALRNFPFDNVNVIDADASLLPFADSIFDMGIAFSAFPHFSDKEQVIDELHRVLKDGATIYIIHLESSRELSEVHHKIGGVIENDELPDADKLRKMFDGHSFRDVSIDDKPGLYLTRATNSKQN